MEEWATFILGLLIGAGMVILAVAMRDRSNSERIARQVEDLWFGDDRG